MIGNGTTDSLKRIIEIKKEKYNLVNAQIIIKNSITNGKSEADINDLKEGIIEDMFTKQENQLKAKSDEIWQLKKHISNKNSFNLKREQAIQEFYALYGKPKELIIERAINHKLNGNDTSLVVVFKTSSTNFNGNELKKMEDWLSVKFSIDKIKIIKE